MSLEEASEREFAELVADHLLVDVNGQKLAAVVDGERVPDELGRDRAAARPGLDGLLLAGRVLLLNLLQKARFDVRSFLSGSAHNSSLRVLRRAAPVGDDHPAPDLLLVAGLKALRELVPGGTRVVIALGLAAASAERMIGRVHGAAANGRADAEMAIAAGLAERDRVVLEVADLADRRVTGVGDHADLARGHLELRVARVLGHELRLGAGRAHHLRALAGVEFEAVDEGTFGNLADGQRVSDLDLGLQGEALRGLSLKAEINCDMVIKPHLQVMHKNFIDQNPYDTKVIRDLDFIVKSVTDKDFRPEQSKKLLEFLQFATSIRQAMPLDFNPMPIIKYFARSVGINPRELKEPRPEIDRMLDVLQRTNANTELKTAMIGEMEGLQNQNPTVSGVPSPAGRPAVPAAMGVI